MRFNLIFFMNLAAIAWTRRLSPDSLLTDLPGQLSENCPDFVDRLKKFENCEVPNTFDVKYLKQAQPFMCFLALNTIKEICSENDADLRHVVEAYNKTRENTTVCPFTYVTKNKIDVKVKNAADYFINEDNCKAVCDYSAQTVDDCTFMVYVNNVMTKLMEKGVGKGKQSASRESRPPLRQHIPPNALNGILGDRTQKTDNIHDLTLQTKAGDSIIKESETISKTAVKTETTSECETKNKENEEKTSNVKVVAIPKPEISENIKKLNNSSHIVNSYINKTLSKVSNKMYVNVNSDNNNNKNNNINDNIRNNNKGGEGKDGQDEGKATEIDLTHTQIPSLKEFNDQNLFSPSSAKKDYTYDSTIKSLQDDPDDDDNNEEMLENLQPQDVLSPREYESGKIVNPKELYNGNGLFQAEDSHFSAYFLMTISIIIIGYIIYHNKNKIVAYALEGRRSRNGRRRPTSASYRKLDSNLEEAIASNPSHASVTNVVY